LLKLQFFLCIIILLLHNIIIQSFYNTSVTQNGGENTTVNIFIIVHFFSPNYLFFCKLLNHFPLLSFHLLSGIIFSYFKTYVKKSLVFSLYHVVTYAFRTKQTNVALCHSRRYAKRTIQQPE